MELKAGVNPNKLKTRQNKTKTQTPKPNKK